MKKGRFVMVVGIVGIAVFLISSYIGIDGTFKLPQIGFFLFAGGWSMMAVSYIADKLFEPLKQKVWMKEGGHRFTTYVYIDRVTGRVFAPLQSADRVIWRSTEEEMKDASILRAPLYRLTNRPFLDKLEMLGQQYEFSSSNC
jgi:hypothetical protein